MVLYDEILRHLMTFAHRRCDLAQVNKVWKEIAHKLPLRRLAAPKLPTSVHIELCSNIVAMQREVFVVSQHLWATPLEINRFFWMPSLSCVNDDGTGGKSRKGEWYVSPEDQKVAITWRQAVKLCCGLIEFAGRVSDEYPHFCEISDGKDVSFRGYVSEESVTDLLCGAKDGLSSPRLVEID